MSFALITLALIVAVAYDSDAVSLPSSSSILQSIQNAVAKAQQALPTTKKVTTTAGPLLSSQCMQEFTDLYNILLKPANKALAKDLLKYCQQMLLFKLGVTSSQPTSPTSIVPAYIDQNCMNAAIKVVTKAQLQQYLPLAESYVAAL